MFQATRRRLALWYTTVTAVLLLLFASGFYWYVRNTLVERVDDTLNHVVEIVTRSLVLETVEAPDLKRSVPYVNPDASFRDNADTVEDDHIDLEWFNPAGELVWSTWSEPLSVPLRLNPKGETVKVGEEQVFRQITQEVQLDFEILGYLRVSHPWFEVTKPSRQLIVDLSLGTTVTVGAVAAIGWFLSGLAIAPVRDSYQRLKQFTADASHELRNPIAVIQTNVQVALSDPDPHWQQQQLQVVERLTRRLGRLVDDLLFLARQDSNTAKPPTALVSLYALLMEVAEEQEAIAQEKGIHLRLIRPASLPDLTLEQDQTSPLYLVQGDRDQLTRLFTNLISNALRYTPPGGAVTVDVQGQPKASGHMVAVRIIDTGIGIPAEALPHVFERFYRVDPSRTRASLPDSQSSAGSGLGLAIAKVIVNHHHGYIEVVSKPDVGSTFTVYLPWHNWNLSPMAK
jgi:OmpR-family two-component system manganese-sensing sensor histidine kinase